jgi:hypothetical protein
MKWLLRRLKHSPVPFQDLRNKAGEKCRFFLRFTPFFTLRDFGDLAFFYVNTTKC